MTTIMLTREADGTLTHPVGHPPECDETSKTTQLACKNHARWRYAPKPGDERNLCSTHIKPFIHTEDFEPIFPARS